MRISISFASIRQRWLDNTFRALGRQTMPHEDWEFLMVDDWGDRWNEVQALAEQNQVNVKYMRSKPYHWKSNRQLGNARNTSFIHAEGEVVAFLDDYSWIEFDWLRMHWRIYQKYNCGVMGVVHAVKTNLGSIRSKNDLEVEKDRPDERLKNIDRGKHLYPAPAGTFWTFNASCPLTKIIEVNGYDEEFNCSGEDDVDLGIRMSRVGLRYYFCAEQAIAVYHMRHNGGQSRPSPFKPEECHKVTKELYGTKYDGSWGLLERNSRVKPWEVNQGYFRLAEARSNRDKYPFNEYKIS